jgi:hypothetical protein
VDEAPHRFTKSLAANVVVDLFAYFFPAFKRNLRRKAHGVSNRPIERHPSHEYSVCPGREFPRCRDPDASAPWLVRASKGACGQERLRGPILAAVFGSCNLWIDADASKVVPERADVRVNLMRARGERTGR